MIDRLVRQLEAANLDLTAEQIADALWLAMVMRKGASLPPPLPEPAGPAPRAVQPPSVPVSEKKPPAPPPAPSNEVPAPARGPLPSEPPRLPVVLPRHEPVVAHVLPFKVPGAAALPRALELGRALRPLHRRVPSRRVQIIDELASAEQIAETRVWAPVLRPEQARWLELALVVDAGASMAIWHQAIVELRDLLQFHGAFRNVRVWRLYTDGSEGELLLQAGLGENGGTVAKSPPRELLDPSGRRLVLVVSDCVSRRWHTGEVPALLADWGQVGPVAVLQVLPEPLWSRTALRNGLRVNLRAPRPGVANTHLLMAHPQWSSQVAVRASSPVVPVLSLEESSLGRWARFVAGGAVAVRGFELHPGPLPSRREVLQVPPSAEERVDRFFSTATEPARRLAGLLAAAPVNLAVMRLIRETMVPEADHGHIAEVFLGGLLRELPGQVPSVPADERQYDFQPGVRELLLESLPAGSARTVLVRVSDFLERRMGQARHFSALLVDPTKDVSSFVERHQVFASIAAQVLRRLGGTYADLARRIQTFSQPYGSREHVRLQLLSLLQQGSHQLLSLLNHGQQSYRELLLLLRHRQRMLEAPSGTPSQAMESVHVERPRSGRWVLVAGSSGPRLSERERWMCEALGEKLAQAGHGLITGDSSGVDGAVARAFHEELRRVGVTAPEAIQVVPSGGRPALDTARLIRATPEQRGYEEALLAADVVVLIGGGRGTSRLYRGIRAMNKLVLPIPETGGEAEHIFNQLWANDEARWRLELSLPINSLWEAADLATRIARSIQLHPSRWREAPRNPWAWLGRMEGPLRQVAQEYERSREVFPRGAARTRSLEMIVEHVTSLAADVEMSAEGVRRAFAHAGPGERIVLLGLLMSPRPPTCFDVTCSMVSRSLSAFEQSTALRVLDLKQGLLAPRELQVLRETLEWLIRGDDLHLRQDTYRAELARRLLVDVGRRVRALTEIQEEEQGEESEDEDAPDVQAALRRDLEEESWRELIIGKVIDQLEDITSLSSGNVLEQLSGRLIEEGSSLPSDTHDATIVAAEEMGKFSLNYASLERAGGSAITLQGEFAIGKATIEARIDEVTFESMEREEQRLYRVTDSDGNGGLLTIETVRPLHVRVRLLLEFEPRDDNPFDYISGVFVEEIEEVQVLDSDVEEIEEDEDEEEEDEPLA